MSDSFSIEKSCVMNIKIPQQKHLGITPERFNGIVTHYNLNADYIHGKKPLESMARRHDYLTQRRPSCESIFNAVKTSLQLDGMKKISRWLIDDSENGIKVPSQCLYQDDLFLSFRLLSNVP